MGLRSLTDTTTGTKFEINNQAVATVVPLGTNAVFTSAPIANLDSRRLVGSVFADQAGTLAFSFSDDGTIWEPLATTVAVTANTYATFDQVIYGGLIRLVYTNGAVANTVFRLTAYTSKY